MEISDRIKIINDAGVMDISVFDLMKKSTLQSKGLLFDHPCRIRVESHKGDNGKLLVTFYENFSDNRLIYIIEYDGQNVSYYVGKILAFEHEEKQVYRTI